MLAARFGKREGCESQRYLLEGYEEVEVKKSYGYGTKFG